MSEHETHTVPMYPALSLLEKKAQPLRYGQAPFWRPPIASPSHDVYVPVWNWASIHEPIEGQTPLTLDVNGAYLGAIGAVTVAHGNLRRQGEWDYLPAPSLVPPGYYQITVPHWAFGGTIVSPLGDSSRTQTESTLWIAHPTLILLLELLEEGSLAHFGIVDSYTCPATANFRTWAKELKAVRTRLLDTLDTAHPSSRPAQCACLACARYDAFKEGYSAALSMMLTGEKCKARRPDWSHAVYAQHAAASWRKAWRYTATGRTLLAMGATDELTIIAQDLPEVLDMPKPPFHCDHTGRRLGAFKAKAKATPRPETRPAALIDDAQGIL